MGKKRAGRKPPPAQDPAAGWRLLPPLAAAPERPTEADALASVVAALDVMRAEFVEAHGREPTEAEVIELVSLGLADGLDDLGNAVPIEKEGAALGYLPDATEDDDEDDGDDDEPTS